MHGLSPKPIYSSKVLSNAGENPLRGVDQKLVPLLGQWEIVHMILIKLVKTQRLIRASCLRLGRVAGKQIIQGIPVN